jgi:cytochrome P450
MVALEQTREDVHPAWTMPLDQINVADPVLFQNNDIYEYFRRLRAEDPVHLADGGEDIGRYWSVTKWHDIVHVDTNHEIYSSEPTITLFDPKDDFRLAMFIAMDPPKHDVQRKTVQPIVAPASLASLESVIRERAGKILDELPRGEVFDWVDRVSIELTTQMLATLFDFPWEDRRLLTWWSDVATSPIEAGLVASEDERRAILFECVAYFTNLWNERVNAEPKPDLISMLAHGEHTRNMDQMEYLGNLILLIVGGNDTTRNSISGGLYALNKNPAEYDKLRAGGAAMIPGMVSETIRWQTPLAYMRRTVTQDTELGGKSLKKGDKVAMWYVSGNRDEDVIENGEAFIIDRPRARQHMSFGFGIHRCVGNRLAEMQLRVVWEEILKRFQKIELVGEPERVYSSFVKGYAKMPVRIVG